jgi:hypothetical protein
VNSPKNLLLAFLVLTTVGGAVLSWWQYNELVELRAATLDRNEAADLRARIADLERQNRGLQDQLALGRGGDDLDALLAEGSPAGERRDTARGDRPRGDRERGRGPDGARQQMTALRELMAKPEVQAMLSQQQKAAVENRYGALFKNLNLSPEQTEKLKTLLADRANTRRDIEEAARAQGINPRENPEAFRKLFTDAQNELNASIKATIGDSGFAQLQNYEQTLPQRNVVDNLQQRLSATSLPLTPAQAEQLVQILATNAPPRTTSTTTAGASDVRGPGDFGPGGGPGGFGSRGFGGPGGPGGPDLGRMLGGGGGGATITAAAVAQAQTVLAPPQVEALQKLQQQQQAQQQLQQLVRETLAATAAANASSSGNASGSAGTNGNAPSRKRGGATGGGGE